MVIAGVLFASVGFGNDVLADAQVADTRPYEFINAARTRDAIAPLEDFETENGWSAVASNGIARARRSQERQLFGQWTLAVTMNAGEVAVRPAAPLAITNDDFNALGVWVRGICPNYGRPKPHFPKLSFVFADDAGTEMHLPSGFETSWYDWHWLMRRFTAAEKTKLVGKRFNGFVFGDATNATGQTFFIDNIAFFKDDLNGKLDLTPVDPKTLGIPTRPEGALPASSVDGASNAVVTNGDWITLSYVGSDGRLVYRWNRVRNTPHELRAQWNDEPEFRPMWKGGVEGAGKANWRLDIRGKTLVLDVSADAGAVTKVNYGHSALATSHVKVPMYWGNHVDLTGSTFSFVFSDWYSSQASAICSRWEIPWSGQEDCSIYRPATDGRYNPVRERLYLTVSPVFCEVLPTIANPISPWKHVTGTHAWYSYGSTANRERDREAWRKIRALGIRDMIITDHETCFRDEGESFTFRLDPAPAKGGEQGLREWTRFLIDELGYYYGPYNNFTDFAPVNANWSLDHVSREPDGSPARAWRRCYAPKPLYGLAKCREYTPILKERFGFNTAYCDVHTFFAPWNRTDYDARTPGAAKFATTYYAYLAILDCQRKIWNGPVYSEGFRHALYAGVVDGNYSQARIDAMRDPWVVDFNLLKIHPLECDFGMGNLEMWFRDQRMHNRKADDATLDGQLDHFIAAELAFGNAPYLAAEYLWYPSSHGPTYSPNCTPDFERGAPRMMRSYFMPLALARHYTQQAALEIRYADAAGRLETTSDAIRSGAVKRNQILVRYADGTCVVVNGSRTERLRTTWQGREIELSPTGYLGWTADGQVEVISTDDGEGRYDYAVAPDYVFVDTRGRSLALSKVRGNGVGARYRDSSGWHEVVHRGQLTW